MAHEKDVVGDLGRRAKGGASRRLPPLNALRAFEAAARHASFTKAAQELNVTPTAISHHVRSLEDRLGFRLFHRLNNMLALTDKGRAYLPALRDAFDRIAQSTELLSAEADAILKLSTRPNFALRWLIPRLPDFRARYADLEIRLSTGQRSLDFARNGADVAIRYGEDWPDLHCEPLFSARKFPVCSPAVVSAERPLRVPADLARFGLLHVAPGMDDWRAWLTAVGAAAIDPDLGLKFDSYALTLQAALHGLGVAIAPQPFVVEDLEAGRLIAPFRQSISDDSAWTLACPVAALEQRKVAVFRDWILEHAAQARSEPCAKELALAS